MAAQEASTDSKIVQGRLEASAVDLEAILQELQPFLDSRTTSGFGDHGNTIYKLEFVDAAEPQWIVNGEDPRYGNAITLAQPMPPLLKRIKDLLFEQMQANGDMLKGTYNAEFAADNGELGFLQVSIPLEFGNELTLERLRAAGARGDVRETYGKHIDKPALFRGGANYIASLTVCGSACITIWRGREEWTFPMEALQWYAISKDIPHAVESGTDRIALVFRPKVLSATPPGSSVVASTNRRESVARQDRRLEKKRVSSEESAPAESPQKRATKAAATKRPTSRSTTSRRKR